MAKDLNFRNFEDDLIYSNISSSNSNKKVNTLKRSIELT